MAKIQLQIDDSVSEILDKLSRRSDKTLFVEMAIKKAYKNKAIKELFSWNTDKPNQSEPENEPPKGGSGKKRVNFDKDFS